MVVNKLLLSEHPLWYFVMQPMVSTTGPSGGYPSDLNRNSPPLLPKEVPSSSRAWALVQEEPSPELSSSLGWEQCSVL